MSKGDLLDVMPYAKVEQVIAMLRTTVPDHGIGRLDCVTRRAWADGYRSILGLHDRALHILEYGLEQ